MRLLTFQNLLNEVRYHMGHRLVLLRSPFRRVCQVYTVLSRVLTLRARFYNFVSKGWCPNGLQ